MNFIQISNENLENEHICCALSGNADARRCAAAKKGWMQSVFDDGYQFHKLDAQGKVFIETVPAEHAWCPLAARGWLFIDCFWVSGQYKGQGHAGHLLNIALERAKREKRYGLVALSADKKRPFLSDPGFYRYKGFARVDTAPPYYELLALPLVPEAPLPTFLPQAKNPSVPHKGLSVFYSDHCPHTSKYVALQHAVATKLAVPFHAHKLTNYDEAQKSPNPFSTYALFYDGKFITNEIMSEGRLRKFIESSLH